MKTSTAQSTGIDIRFDRDSGKRRKLLIILEKLGTLPSEMSRQIQNTVAVNVVWGLSDIRGSNIVPRCRRSVPATGEA